MTRRQVVVFLCLVTISSATVAAHDELRFVGTVQRLDVAKNVLTMRTKDDGKDVDLPIPFTAKTVVERDGKPVPRAELTPGTHVVADVLQDHDGGLEGVKVRIVPPPRR